MVLYNFVYLGEILRELVVEIFGLIVIDVVQYLNVSCKIVLKVLNVKGVIIFEMVVRLELVFGKLFVDYWF